MEDKNLMTYFFNYAMLSIYNREMDKNCILSFSRKSNLRIIKNYRGITLTGIAAKVYNAMLIICIQPEIGKILRKNQNSSQRNPSMTS